jgi:RNA polymerase sigma-70 factor (ECF subfamily)
MASREPLADEVLQHRERVKMFERALQGLTPLQRRVFLMRRVDGRSRTEIAEALGLSVEAVKKHLVRAMAVLADVIDETPTGANGEGGDDR